MKINAIIESKDGGTLVLDFPRSIYDVYEKLQSVGIRQSPHQITLSDEEGDDVRVKLYSEDEIGKHCGSKGRICGNDGKSRGSRAHFY